MSPPVATDPDPATRTPTPTRTNPVPLVLGAVAALVVIIGMAVLLLGDGGAEGDAGVTELSDPEAVASLDDDATSAAVGSMAPDLPFDYLRGSGPGQPAGSFADFRGRPVVVNFFAQWCAPCVDEMPDLQEAFEANGGQVAFLGIATNETRENAHALRRTTGVTYTLAHDPSGEDILVAFRGMAMPTTVFLDAEGRVARVWSGRITAEQVQQVIDQDLLG